MKIYRNLIFIVAIFISLTSAIWYFPGALNESITHPICRYVNSNVLTVSIALSLTVFYSGLIGYGIYFIFYMAPRDLYKKYRQQKNLMQ